MLNQTLSFHSKLAGVAIRTTHETDSLESLDRELFNTLPFVANQAKTPNAAAISEGDVLAIQLDPPSGGFVLHRTVIMLKLRIAFLARLLVAAVLIEARNREPGPVRRCLTRLGVEPC